MTGLRHELNRGPESSNIERKRMVCSIWKMEGESTCGIGILGCRILVLVGHWQAFLKSSLCKKYFHGSFQSTCCVSLL